MPFGIPSEDFHGGLGIPENETCVINYDDTDGEAKQDDYDPYTDKYAFCPPMTDEEFVKGYKAYMDEYATDDDDDDDDDDLSDEECSELAEEAYDNLIHSLIEAGGEVRELRELLKLANESLLYMLMHDKAIKGLLNEKGVAALYVLQSDGWSPERAFENFKRVSEYLEKEEEE